jgi:hypothetical protein
MLHQSLCRPGAAEFPHDNPRLDFGALWLGSALCELRDALPEHQHLADPSSDPPPMPVAAPAPSVTPPANDPIAAFISAVLDVAAAHGAGDRVAYLEVLLERGGSAPVLPSYAFSTGARVALIEGRILEPTDDGLMATASFAESKRAWLAALGGNCSDLSSCGDSMLDAWTADLVARLLAEPARTEAVRRDLRRRGIAAFGMV